MNTNFLTVPGTAMSGPFVLEISVVARSLLPYGRGCGVIVSLGIGVGLKLRGVAVGLGVGVGVGAPAAQ